MIPNEAPVWLGVARWNPHSFSRTPTHPALTSLDQEDVAVMVEERKLDEVAEDGEPEGGLEVASVEDQAAASKAKVGKTHMPSFSGVVESPSDTYNFIRYLGNGCYGACLLMQSATTGNMFVFKVRATRRPGPLFCP
jgi:hypothetical protein